MNFAVVRLHWKECFFRFAAESSQCLTFSSNLQQIFFVFKTGKFANLYFLRISSVFKLVKNVKTDLERYFSVESSDALKFLTSDFRFQIITQTNVFFFNNVAWFSVDFPQINTECLLCLSKFKG